MDGADDAEIGGLTLLLQTGSQRARRLAPRIRNHQPQRGCPGEFRSGHSNGMIRKIIN